MSNSEYFGVWVKMGKFHPSKPKSMTLKYTEHGRACWVEDKGESYGLQIRCVKCRRWEREKSRSVLRKVKISY